MSKRIHELAVPKGNVSANCEICGNKATTMCENCRVTHYCSQEHKHLDALSFHKGVCQMLFEIRKEHALPFTEADRIAAKEALIQNKKKVMKQAEIVTRKWLLERKAVNAYPSAMISWNIANDLHPPDSLDVIYSTCLVSEMFLNLGDYKVGEQYMVQASWISQKFDVLPAVTLSQLYRLRGLVFMASKRWSLAREAFAECVYAVAMQYGIMDIRMGIPYGLLGLSQLKHDNVSGAMASFHRMTDKWLKLLLSQYRNKIMRVATESEMASDDQIRELEFQYKEAKNLFEWIYEGVRDLGMNTTTDLINFKILCVQALSHMRENLSKEAVVFKEEALATATRTKQDKAVPPERVHLLIQVLGEDYLLRWEKKHNRPRTIATKYLEMIKAIDV